MIRTAWNGEKINEQRSCNFLESVHPSKIIKIIGNGKKPARLKKSHVYPPPKTIESGIKVKEELSKIYHTSCVLDLAVGTLEAGNPSEEENIPPGLDALDILFKEKVK